MHSTGGATIASVWKIAVARRGAIVGAMMASVWAAMALAAFLLMRRVNGAISAPLPLPQLVGTALALTAWSVCVSAFASRFTQKSNLRPHRSAISLEQLVLSWLPTVVIIVVASACSLPVSRVADWLIWIPAIAVSAFAPRFLPRLVRDSTSRHNASQIAEGNDNEQLLQRTTRTRAADGSERIEATLFADFPSGERIAILYIAFCPPFERLPEIEVSATDGPDAETKIVQLLYNGAQIEVRLVKPAVVAERVTLELIAQST